MMAQGSLVKGRAKTKTRSSECQVSVLLVLPSIYRHIFSLVLENLSKLFPPVLIPRLSVLIRTITPSYFSFPELFRFTKTPEIVNKLLGENVPYIIKTI